MTIGAYPEEQEVSSHGRHHPLKNSILHKKHITRIFDEQVEAAERNQYQNAHAAFFHSSRYRVSFFINVLKELTKPIPGVHSAPWREQIGRLMLLLLFNSVCDGGHYQWALAIAPAIILYSNVYNIAQYIPFEDYADTRMDLVPDVALVTHIGLALYLNLLAAYSTGIVGHWWFCPDPSVVNNTKTFVYTSQVLAPSLIILDIPSFFYANFAHLVVVVLAAIFDTGATEGSECGLIWFVCILDEVFWFQRLWFDARRGTYRGLLRGYEDTDDEENGQLSQMIVSRHARKRAKYAVNNYLPTESQRYKNSNDSPYSPAESYSPFEESESSESSESSSEEEEDSPRKGDSRFTQPLPSSHERRIYNTRSRTNYAGGIKRDTKYRK